MLKLYCNFFGHTYIVTKKVTYHVKEYTCTHCAKQLTTSGNGTLIELTPKFKEINTVLGRVHAKRLSRLKTKTVASSIY